MIPALSGSNGELEMPYRENLTEQFRSAIEGLVEPPKVQPKEEWKTWWECPACKEPRSRKPYEICAKCRWTKRLKMTLFLVIWACASKGVVNMANAIFEGVWMELVGSVLIVGLFIGMAWLDEG
jgi:hypothetical protein